MGPGIIVAGAVVAGGVALAARKSSATLEAKPAVKPGVVLSNRVIGTIARGRPELAVEATPPAGQPPPTPPPGSSSPSGFGLKLPGEFGQVAAAIPAAAKTLELVGGAVTQLTGSQGAGNFTQVLPVQGALGFLGQHLGEEAAKLVGGNEELQKASGQFGGLLLAGGPAALGVPIGYGASAVVGAIGGQQAEQDFRAAVAQLDPTSSTSAVGSALNTVVNTGFGIVKGIFG